MRRFLLYAHGGAANHGSEAIVKMTIDLLRKAYPDAWVGISTHFPEQDVAYGIKADKLIAPNATAWELEKKAFEQEEKYRLAREMYADALAEITPDTVLLSVGGDNYCYGNWHRLAVFQEKAKECGAKSILWGASIEPDHITEEMVEVLNTYSCIIARESMTFEALREKGVTTRVELLPDVAFRLPVGECNAGVEADCIGINFSPLVLRREKKAGILLENFVRLVDYIISQGKKAVLIPHVTVRFDNDIDALKELYDAHAAEWRDKVILVDKVLTSEEYKGIISRCSLLVCARTHASIAAYSLGIPALVLGYSVKSKGIAKDLSFEDMIISIEEIQEKDALVGKFRLLCEREAEYRDKLQGLLPTYISRTEKYTEIVEEILS